MELKDYIIAIACTGMLDDDNQREALPQIQQLAGVISLGGKEADLIKAKMVEGVEDVLAQLPAVLEKLKAL